MPYDDGGDDDLFDKEDGTVNQDLGTTLEALWGLRDDRVLSEHAVMCAVMLIASSKLHRHYGAYCCWPSSETLAERCRYSERTLFRALAELSALGLWEKATVSREEFCDDDDPDDVAKRKRWNRWIKSRPSTTYIVRLDRIAMLGRTKVEKKRRKGKPPPKAA